MIDSWNSAILNEDKRSSFVTGLLEAVNNGSGKNLNLYPYYHTTRTNNGVTFTDNGDGTVTATGKSTASVKSIFACHSRTANSKNYLFLPNGKYILSGCPSGGANGKYSLEVGCTKGGVYFGYGIDTGDGLSFTINGDDNSTSGALVEVVCNCYYDYQLPDLGIIFKPMILYYPNNNLSWVPYIPTTYEQANLLSSLKCSETTAGNYSLKATVDSDGVITYSWEAIT